MGPLIGWAKNHQAPYHRLVARSLLERDRELATLIEAAGEAAAGTGSVVLLHGEAGIGKTSLVSAIRSQLPDGTRMLVGSCDALSTPRTLGPFRDLIAAVGPRLADALQLGERDQVMDALLDELRQPPPTTLVIEDVHWADEATVDTLRFLVRRIAQLPVVLLLTYRDDELSRDHRLSQLLGDASHAEQVHHLSPQRLTEPAVRELVAGSSLDFDEIFALSDGNPYSLVSWWPRRSTPAFRPPSSTQCWADSVGLHRLTKRSSSCSPLCHRPWTVGLSMHWPTTTAQSRQPRNADCSPSAGTESRFATNSPVGRLPTPYRWPADWS
jgi:hypothetical protein